MLERCLATSAWALMALSLASLGMHVASAVHHSFILYAAHFAPYMTGGND